MKYLIICLCLLHLANIIEGIRCYLENTRETNNTCKLSCSAQLMNRNKPNQNCVISYGCLTGEHSLTHSLCKNDAFFPDERCCRTHDFCNGEFVIKDFLGDIKCIKPGYPDNQYAVSTNSTQTTHAPQSSNWWHKYETEIIIIVVAAFIVISICILCSIIFCRKFYFQVVKNSQDIRGKENCIKVIIERFCCYFFLQSKNTHEDSGHMIHCPLPSNHVISMNGNGEQLMDDVATTSGSGLPLLQQRTMARQLKVTEKIGTGRFSEVWRAEWINENRDVAVKMFSTREYESFEHEVAIYNSTMLRHDHILGFIASDTKDRGSFTLLWLITDYHPNGSLFEYLKCHTIDAAFCQNRLHFPYGLTSEFPEVFSDRVSSPLLNMLHSLAHGLSYLHTEIPGAAGKIAKVGIAHRDIKSRNVLVRNDGTCCIADLGLAVTSDDSCFTSGKGEGDHLNDRLRLPINESTSIPCRSETTTSDDPPQKGTCRYMAPEALSCTLDMTQFEPYKAGDVYSMALVMWEIIWCSSANQDSVKKPVHSLPYTEFVGDKPTLENMYEVVVAKGKRPSFSEALNTYGTPDQISPKDSHCCTAIPLQKIITILTECWHPDFNVRLSAMNVRKKLYGMIEELGQLHSIRLENLLNDTKARDEREEEQISHHHRCHNDSGIRMAATAGLNDTSGQYSEYSCSNCGDPIHGGKQLSCSSYTGDTPYSSICLKCISNYDRDIVTGADGDVARYCGEPHHVRGKRNYNSRNDSGHCSISNMAAPPEKKTLSSRFASHRQGSSSIFTSGCSCTTNATSDSENFPMIVKCNACPKHQQNHQVSQKESTLDDVLNDEEPLVSATTSLDEISYCETGPPPNVKIIPDNNKSHGPNNRSNIIRCSSNEINIVEGFQNAEMMVVDLPGFDTSCSTSSATAIGSLKQQTVNTDSINTVGENDDLPQIHANAVTKSEFN